MRVLALAVFLFLASRAFAAPEGYPVCAKSEITLRKGPGKSFPVTWKVGKEMPFLKYESKSGWTKVRDLEGEIHWAPSRALTSAHHCVVVKAAVALLRQEPSTTAPPAEIHTLDRYTPLKRLDSKDDWIHVEYEPGHQAWIHESNVWKPMRIQSVNF